METKYLIIGSSHAGLSATDEIRINDPDGSLTMVSMEDCLPYSPTVLPYIVSGKVDAGIIRLRDDQYFKDQNITFLKGKKVVKIDTQASKVTLDDNSEIGYEKVLIATGSEPTLPPIPGLKESKYHVLRTMQDAQEINKSAEQAKTAVILGTGLVGMHAAEGLAEKGLKVEVIRGRRPAVLPNYFDKASMQMIHKVFLDHGIGCNLDNQVASIEPGEGEKAKVILKNGSVIDTDMLVVGTGVRSRMDFFANGAPQMEEGILVDETMQTSVGNVWAAGDVAQAVDFFSEKKELNAILPDAFEQGKIAGMSMSGNLKAIEAVPGLGKQEGFSYNGGVSMNTFNFYGNRSFAVGLSLVEDDGEYAIHVKFDTDRCFYQKLVFKGDYLVGAIGINTSLDPGVIMNIIRRKINLKGKVNDFIDDPQNVSRRIMWDSWRGVAKV